MHPRASALASFLLYASATMRNVQLAYILDRYMHILLLAAACLPAEPPSSGVKTAQSLGILLYRLQIAFIYLDAG